MPLGTNASHWTDASIWIARLLGLFAAAFKRRRPPHGPFGTSRSHLDARTARLNLTTIQASSTVTLW